MLTKSSPNCHLQSPVWLPPPFICIPHIPAKLQFLEQDLSASSLLRAVSSGRILPLLPFQPDDFFSSFQTWPICHLFFRQKFFSNIGFLYLLYSLFSFTFRLIKDFFSYIRDISVLTSKILVRRLHISHMPWSTYLYSVSYTVATSLFMEWIDWHLEQMFVGGESYWVATSLFLWINFT